MTTKSDIEMARLAVAKVTRTEIRLKHQLAADKEINDVLPRRLIEFDAAVQQGTLPGMYLRLVSGTDEDDTTN